MRAWAISLLLLLLTPSPSWGQTSLWELSESGWDPGEHNGTRAVAGSLTLAPSAKHGVYTRRLPEAPAFDSLVFSLNHEPWPRGCRVEASVRLRIGGTWTPWLPLGAYGSEAGLPRSASHPPGAAEVKIDHVRSKTPADAADLRLVLAQTGERPPCVRRVALSAWVHGPPAHEPDRASPAWGKVLDVPLRSQQVEDREIAGRICSPTSLSMVLAYWGCVEPTVEVANGVYDHGAKLYGNWSFNVSYASSQGFDATATHLDGIGALEREIAAGRPVVISHRYSAGELTNSPIRSTDGHLIVVVGFTKSGDVVVNDPAAHPGRGQSVRRTYRRAQLRRSWLANHDGVAYLLRPRRGHE